MPQPPAADPESMDACLVECLRCGQPHLHSGGGLRYLQQGECPRCGYLGWAASSELTDSGRRELREALRRGRPDPDPFAGRPQGAGR